MSDSMILLFSCIHGITFYLYTANYARLRKNDVYATEKRVVDKMPLARSMTKLAFTLSTILVLISFWMPEGTLGFFQTPMGLRFFGLILTLAAFLFLRSALNQLGKNYSPLFDTHKPQFIVKGGLYRYIRHPVYLCNMLIILGYVLSSSSLWVFISSLWGWGYMVRSILREDQYLASEFPEYMEYQKKTWRIIPLVF